MLRRKRILHHNSSYERAYPVIIHLYPISLVTDNSEVMPSDRQKKTSPKYASDTNFFFNKRQIAGWSCGEKCRTGSAFALWLLQSLITSMFC